MYSYRGKVGELLKQLRKEKTTESAGTETVAQVKLINSSISLEIWECNLRRN